MALQTEKNDFRIISAMITIPRGWYRAQKPLNPGNTKKLRKKIQNPPPQVAPRKYEKMTEKIQKR